VFGSLFLSQYRALWDYDVDNQLSKLHLQKSDACSLNDVYIGSAEIPDTPVTFIN
jgi:hypothetical protein